MRNLILCGALVLGASSVGCSSVQQNALPTIGKHLNEAQAGWGVTRASLDVLCSEENQALLPLLAEHCPTINSGREITKAGLNGIKEVYDQANSEAE